MTTPPQAPLGALLDPGREQLAEIVTPGTVQAGPAMRAYALALLAERAAPLLVVVPTEKDAEGVADDLGAYLGGDDVAIFPAWETLPHERLSPQPATVGQRLRVLDRLRVGTAGGAPLRAVVAPVRALLQPMDPRLTERHPIRLTGTYRGGLDGLVEGLAALGYTRTPMVEHRGEFAVRGGIVDVFPSAADHPIRVEFWGDDVDSIREFAAGSQRTLEPVESVAVDAARELVLDAETADTARLLAKRVPALAEQLQLLADGVGFEGMESLVTAIHPTPAYLPDFFPDDAGVAVLDPVRVADRAVELRDQAAALLVAGWGAHGATDSGFLLADDSDTDAVGFAEWGDIGARIRGPRWDVTPFASDTDVAAVPGLPWDTFRGDIARAAHSVRQLSAEGLAVVLTTAGHGPALRLAEVLRDEGIAAPPVGPLTALHPGAVVITESSLRLGFRSTDLGIAVLGEWDLFGPRRTRASRRLPSKRAASETVVDLQPGDPIVHSVHGVGRYVGMVTRELPGPSTFVGGGTAGKVTRDYVVLEYAGGDRLFVPSDQVDAIAKYVGGEEPRIMRMGGADWERAKSKVRKAVREMAGELIRLYQARMHAPGHPFGPDGDWQSELETAFPYEETPDQVVAIDEVKQDMEAPLPMDRLICGDVGFGKTEIAVRAAAKAVFDGKQVAVLVPTTLLAQQHGETFTERFSGFPVKVVVLSRFATAAQQREIIDGLAAGTVDLVVGTHRLLGGDVTFKDLGLMVVDEEQRFGVAHKEKLKHLRTSVDVLTMTATPIPRTMEMAITGIRDMSTIDTPPEERQPIVTHVGEWDESMAALAVRRELLREGQVFWVHNQIDTIPAAAERVRELVPGARVEFAHGRMDEASLEKIMVRFWQREFDVLVSTTIIESGLDVPNANTLIIERADMLGLAQLYQLRGRVGRSSERGYAYLFYPEHRSMTEEAYKRLETIATFTGLGSGLSISLRDLEIRGAGNVLSGDQSGHVATVGFDEYAKLMQQAVDDFRHGRPVGTGPEVQAEVKLDIPVDAHLPTEFIPDEALRLEAYRKVAAVRDAAGVRAVREELVDRYGRLPDQAERLLAVAALRAMVRRWGIREVTTTPRRTVRCVPVVLADWQEVRLQREHKQAVYNPTAQALELPMPRSGDLVGWLAKTLQGVLGPQRGRASSARAGAGHTP
jgi:transcription-repair coupling factor (superfamily II helicase)